MVSPQDIEKASYSALEWTEFFDEKKSIEIEEGDIFNVYVKGTTGPLFYLIHGGGYSGLTWACFAEIITKKLECQIVAPDLRGHGDTLTKDESDLSSERQIKDIQLVYQKLFADRSKPPPMILIGHSMGGALAIRACEAKLLPNVVALAVIDVVEGSAMSSLKMMHHFLKSRPQQFRSVEESIRWCVKSGTTRNLRAARISMPAQIRRVDKNDEKKGYQWRITLTRTEPFWIGWFNDLSQKFLNCTPAKILILANVDRLDKDLTIGSMQGKFQTEILDKVGHAVHEDSPEKVADIFVALVNRYKVIFNKML
uniref:Protein phosphatase methylesterase 1 n=1 Tax=Acrobeloides nanus TaxID=290746 RepID=A0A914DSZ9_9BILA